MSSIVGCCNVVTVLARVDPKVGRYYIPVEYCRVSTFLKNDVKMMEGLTYRHNAQIVSNRVVVYIMVFMVSCLQLHLGGITYHNIHTCS